MIQKTSLNSVLTTVQCNNPSHDEEGKQQRCCLVTREKLNKSEMIRFVISPEDMVVPDLSGRLPGRGMWLKANENVLNTALQRRIFSRASQRQVRIPEDLSIMIKIGLRRRIIEALGLARRAGQVTYGFVKVREKLAKNRVGAILQAVDGSDEERKRLLSGVKDLPVVIILSAKELGKVFGREHVVHVAIEAGSLASRIRWDSNRLTGFLD